MITQPNAGEADARNTGIALARYDWLLFLDADDWISPLHLERMTRELRSNPDLDAVHCKLRPRCRRRNATLWITTSHLQAICFPRWRVA